MTLVKYVWNVLQRVDDGEEVGDGENVQTPVCMPCSKVPTAAEQTLHGFDSHALPILMSGVRCGMSQQ